MRELFVIVFLLVAYRGIGQESVTLDETYAQKGLTSEMENMRNRANIALQEDDFSAALKIFTELRTRFGDDDGYYTFNITKCQHRLDGKNGTLVVFDALCKKWPHASWIPLLEAERGDSYFRSENYHAALQAYQSAHTLQPGILHASVRSRIQYGYTLMWADSLVAAIQLLAPLRTDSLLGDYILHWTADCYGRLDSTEKRMIELHRLTTGWPQSIHANSAQMEMAGFYYDNQLYNEALSLYRKGDSFASGREEHALIRFRSGEILLKKGCRAQAESLYAEAMELYPRAKWAWKSRIALINSRRKKNKHLTGRSIFYNARVLSAHAQYGSAATEALRFIDRYPQSPLYAKALFVAGMSRYRQKKYKLAGINFSRFLKRFPKDEQAGDAMLYSARCQRKQHLTSAAEKSYRLFAQTFPTHSDADDALWGIAWERESKGALSDAIGAYQNLTKRLPRTRLGKEAVWRAGYCHYKKDDYASAYKVFATIDSTSELYLLDQARYWQAKCLEKMGKPLEAENLFSLVAARYPRTFYSVRALEHLKGAPGNTPDSLFRYDVQDDVVTSEVYANYWLQYSDSLTGGVEEYETRAGLAMQKAMLLLRFHLYDEGLQELIRFEYQVKKNRSKLVELARVYYENGFTYRAYRTFRTLLSLTYGVDSDAFPLSSFHFLYPLKFLEPIRNATQKYEGVDPFIVLALIHQESRFNPNARSRVDARGLMQIMPATGREIARGLHFAPFHADSLLTPAVNLKFGISYLAGQLKRFEGNMVHSLASYNGGGTNVRRWMKRFKGTDPDMFVENIPFRETRKYVKIVLSNYRMYQYLWGPYCLQQTSSKE